MADVAARKRARSPSPGSPDVLASPLEVLIKRRRRGEYVVGRMPPPPVWPRASLAGPSGTSGTNSAAPMEEDGDHTFAENAYASSSHEHSSPLGASYYGDEWRRAQGVDRRRQRQWERLQAPSQQPAPPAHLLPPSSPAPSRNYSANQPYRPMLGRSVTTESMPSVPSSEVDVEVARTTLPHLSSSPVRHEPPGSTPFRANDWSAEERVREWGDEYASQNSLLHSLHLARVESGQSAHASTHLSSSMHESPQRIAGRTTPQQHLTPHMGANPSATHLTPIHTHLPTPYRHARAPHDTPDVALSSPWASSPAFASPFPTAPQASPVNFGPQHGVVHASYEEANRLLAELNVQRIRRHGEHWPDAMDEGA